MNGQRGAAVGEAATLEPRTRLREVDASSSAAASFRCPPRRPAARPGRGRRRARRATPRSRRAPFAADEGRRAARAHAPSRRRAARPHRRLSALHGDSPSARARSAERAGARSRPDERSSRARPQPPAARRRSSRRPARPSAGRRRRRAPTAAGPVLTPTLTAKPATPHARLDVLGVLADDLEDAQRRAGGPLVVVLVGSGNAEVRADAVALVGLHRSAVLLDGTAHHRHALADERLHLVGREPLAERARADDVGEEHRHGAELVVARTVGGGGFDGARSARPPPARSRAQRPGSGSSSPAPSRPGPARFRARRRGRGGPVGRRAGHRPAARSRTARS